MSYKPESCDSCKLDFDKREIWKRDGGPMPPRICNGHLDICRDCKKPDIRINTDGRCNRCWVAWAKAKLARDKRDGYEKQVTVAGLIENAQSNKSS